jgi:hypothetical protein
MQHAVLCYLVSFQIFLLLCLHNRGGQLWNRRLLFQGIKLQWSRYCRSKTFLCLCGIGLEASSGSALVSLRVLHVRCLISAFVRHTCALQTFMHVRYTSVLQTFLHISGTPVPYRHFCICQSHQCITDISAYIRHTSALQTFLHMSGTPVPYRLYICFNSAIDVAECI